VVTKYPSLWNTPRTIQDSQRVFGTIIYAQVEILMYLKNDFFYKLRAKRITYCELAQPNASIELYFIKKGNFLCKPVSKITLYLFQLYNWPLAV
jgi:hypothetical protein